MRDVLGESLRKLKIKRKKRTRMLVVLLVLSLIVSIDVLWSLRQPGWTLAGDADCDIVEHTHDESCLDGENICTIEEHSHTINCYSDESADVESQLDWQQMFQNFPFTGTLCEDLVGVAKSQVGYSESELNFEVDGNGVRHGYTRYGEWYGTPYAEWSALFVSFCLSFAGADPNEFPSNSGVANMAEQWENVGRYEPIGRHEPSCGDLVFFKDNTVGIITEVHNATFYVIRGDVDNSVRGDYVSLYDVSILGWGVTSEQKSNKDMSDISNGPVVSILASGSSTSQAQKYSLRLSRGIKDLVSYLEENEGNYFFTLLDKNNQELPKDGDGSFIVIANTGYKLTMTFNSPNGFEPGTYQYQVPGGLLVDGGEGTFALSNGINVGIWSLTNEGLFTINLNEHINSHTDITISATLGVHFPPEDDPIDFDGKISVTIKDPPTDSEATKVTKWGIQGSDEIEGKTNPDKVYWNVNIVGNKESNILGSVINDRVVHGEWIGNQSYTQSDMDAGLRFGASDPDGNWHSWNVYPGDSNLTWTESGWSYTMPETINCWCGQVTLGNEGWTYYIDYTSTPNSTDGAGTFYYMNRIMVDNQYADGGASFSQGEFIGEVSKVGSFRSDADSGTFLWELNVDIPSRKNGEKAVYFWYFLDYMYLINSEDSISGYIENDAHLASVTATYNGTTIEVPRVQDATPSDPFAWDNAWSPSVNGITYGREINLLCRCKCNEENCQFWNTGCGEYWYEKDDGIWTTNGFCQCWTTTENVKFTFIYETNDLSTVKNYGGLGYKVKNVVDLYYKPNGGPDGTNVSSAQASVPIPDIFKKELTQDFNGFTASYKVTINEAKLVLTNGTPLTIHDVMTKTLAFISGSLAVSAEDADGNVTTLQQGVDYTVTYDGTGNKTNHLGEEVHVLDVVILHPQPVKYILDYDATLVMPDEVTSGIKYSNSASISLWGENITEDSVEKVYADINIATKSYKLELYKTADLTGEPLGGATFGLYNGEGGLITTGVTDSNGKLLFQTNVVEGIIIRDHVLYYVQEVKAPTGYQLNDKKYLFCFCDGTEDSCETCNVVLGDTDGERICFEQTGKIHVTNHLMYYDLPATGGPGIYPLILAGVMFIITPLVYIFIRKRKRERRGVG